MSKGLKKKYIVFIIISIVILLALLISVLVKLGLESYSKFNDYNYEAKIEKNISIEENIDIEEDNNINKNLDSEEFKSNIYAFDKNGLYGFKDSYGDIVIEPKYSGAYDSSEGLAVIYENGRYGYIDINGNLVIKNKYYYASPFNNGLAIVDFEDGKSGVIDKEGNELFRTDKYRLFRTINNYVEVGNNDEKMGMGYLDKSGKEVGQIKYNALGSFVDGLARVEYDKKYGYINEKGEEVIPLIYEYAEDFRNGYAIVKDGTRSKLIDTKGNEVNNPISLENSYDGFIDGIIVGEDVDTYENVVLDKNFNEIYRLPMDYIFTGTTKSGVSVFYNHYNGLSFMDSKGNEKFKIDNANIRVYDSKDIKDFFIIENYDRKTKVGVINLDGEEVIPFKYSDIEVIDQFFICTKEGFFRDDVDIYYRDLKLTNSKIKADYIDKAGEGVLSISKGDDIYFLNKYGQKF